MCACYVQELNKGQRGLVSCRELGKTKANKRPYGVEAEKTTNSALGGDEITELCVQEQGGGCQTTKEGKVCRAEGTEAYVLETAGASCDGASVAPSCYPVSKAPSGVTRLTDGQMLASPAGCEEPFIGLSVPGDETD